MRMLISDKEKTNNYFFRMGSEECSFENGQNFNEGWKERDENEVLIDRVYTGLKPYASLVYCSTHKPMEEEMKKN